MPANTLHCIGGKIQKKLICPFLSEKIFKNKPTDSSIQYYYKLCIKSTYRIRRKYVALQNSVAIQIVLTSHKMF